MTDTTPSAESTRASALSPGGWIPTGVVVRIGIAIPMMAGILVSYRVYGSVNVYYVLMSFFFSLNLVLFLWEICLFKHRGEISDKANYWREQRRRTGRSPLIEFFVTPMALRDLFSSSFWANLWAIYSLWDGSYTDRRTYGFNSDIGNASVSLLPVMFLHVAYTVNFVPAIVVGIVGIMMCWQWIFGTILYFMSFFIAKRHRLISQTEFWLYIWGPAWPWPVFSLLGLYVSIQLVIDGNYQILGH